MQSNNNISIQEAASRYNGFSILFSGTVFLLALSNLLILPLQIGAWVVLLSLIAGLGVALLRVYSQLPAAKPEKKGGAGCFVLSTAFFLISFLISAVFLSALLRSAAVYLFLSGLKKRTKKEE